MLHGEHGEQPWYSQAQIDPKQPWKSQIPFLDGFPAQIRERSVTVQVGARAWSKMVWVVLVARGTEKRKKMSGRGWEASQEGHAGNSGVGVMLSEILCVCNRGRSPIGLLKHCIAGSHIALCGTHWHSGTFMSFTLAMNLALPWAVPCCALSDFSRTQLLLS